MNDNFKLRQGKDQEVFDKRLKNNRMRIIQHGRSDETCYCRICDFNEYAGKVLQKAKRHAEKTGHTIDVYYESWREITYYRR